MFYRSEGAERSCSKSARSTYSFYLFVSYLPFTSNQSVICDKEIVALVRQVANEEIPILVGSKIFCMGCIFMFWIWAIDLRLFMAPCWWGSYFILHLFMYWVCGNDVHVSIMDASLVWELVKLIHSWSHFDLLLPSPKRDFGLTNCKWETSLHRKQ